MAKHAYPALNPLSSGVKAVQTWTSRALPTSTTWRSVCWSPELGMFVAVGGNNVVYSFDGLIWSNQTTGVPSSGWFSVCWSPQLTRFVAVASSGTNKVMYSSNGINWTSVLLSNSVSWADVCWSPQLGLFVAVGTTTTNRVMYSYDGSSNWIQPTVEVPLGGGSIVICWSPQLGLFVAVSYGGQVMISNNGINWSQVSVPYANWYNVSWCADIGLFIAVADSGTNRLMYSPNGINWTSVFIQQFSWESVCWSPELGVAVIVGRNGGGGINTVLTSSLKARPPTSYNVFDSSFNSIDQSGNWTFSAIDINTNLNPSTPLTGFVGTTTKPWGNAVIRDISVSNISVSGDIIPSIIRGANTIGTGGNSITISGDYVIHMFTTSGTFTPASNRPVEVLIVGGGGGGGGWIAGGGGGGGVIYIPAASVSRGVGYSVVVGNGGTSQTNGQASSVFLATAAGGGAGGPSHDNGTGSSGGSGGGAASNNSLLNQGGASSGNSLGPNSGFIYGNRGGNMTTTRTGSATRGAGGGGAGGQGLDTNSNILGDTGQTGHGSGGVGIVNSILGPSYYWGGGGGGGANSDQYGGWGGLGGGGGGVGSLGPGQGGGLALNSGANGGIRDNDILGGGGAGGANTGGGGGASSGGGTKGTIGGTGGSGIVIIRYAQINGSSLGTYSNPWPNANIYDLSAANITVNNLTLNGISSNITTLINSLLTRIATLEQTAVLRTFDTIIGSQTPVSNFTIPVDLVANESVEIDVNIKVFGTNLVNLRAGVNSATLSNQEFDEYNGVIREGSAGVVNNTVFNKSQGNGAILINVESQGLTSVIRMKLYRSHTINDVSSRYHFECKSVYCKAGVGVATVETVGMTNDQSPTGIYLFFPSSATTMTASYSIIEDKRRTSLNGALL